MGKLNRLINLIDYSVFCNLVGVGGLSFRSVSASSSAPDFVFSITTHDTNWHNYEQNSWLLLGKKKHVNTFLYFFFVSFFLHLLPWKYLFRSSNQNFRHLILGLYDLELFLKVFIILTLAWLMRFHLDQISHCQHWFECWFGQSLSFF